MSKKSKTLAILSSLIIFPSCVHAFVPLICDLCTIWAVAWLAISRYFGVDDSVIGVWIWAVLVALIVMTNTALEKKNIRYKFRNTSIVLSYIIFSYISFWYAGVIGIYRNTFFKIDSIFLDKILVSSIIGWLALTWGSLLYQRLKAKNGWHAHFPFEKVVIPISFLIITSVIFYLVTLR